MLKQIIECEVVGKRASYIQKKYKIIRYESETSIKKTNCCSLLNRTKLILRTLNTFV